MKVKIEMSGNEKKAAIIIAVVIALVIYWYNKRYLYVLEAEFENEDPISVILKTGFIFPVKTKIDIKNGFTKKIKLYGYNLLVLKTDSGFDLLIDKKKIYTIYPDKYYQEFKKSPTGRIYLS